MTNFKKLLHFFLHYVSNSSIIKERQRFWNNANTTKSKALAKCLWRKFNPLKISNGLGRKKAIRNKRWQRLRSYKITAVGAKAAATKHQKKGYKQEQSLQDEATAIERNFCQNARRRCTGLAQIHLKVSTRVQHW